jgi:hypothetical protein
MKPRRNHRQEELLTRIEEIEVLIKTSMLTGTISDQERDERLTKLFKERDQIKKALRSLQLNQARCRRYRSRRKDGSQRSTPSGSVADEMEVTSHLGDRDGDEDSMNASCSASIEDDHSSAHSVNGGSPSSSSVPYIDDKMLFQLVEGPEINFLDDLEKNFHSRPPELTRMIIRMRKDYVRQSSQAQVLDCKQEMPIVSSVQNTS